MTPHTNDDFVEKDLAARAAAGQDDTTTQANREDHPDVRTRFRQRAATQKAKDNAGRADLQAFAAILGAAMKRAGVSSSELARMVWGTITDSRGYTVPRNRDRISSYLAGQSYPDPENVQKLADALGIPVEKLASTRPPAPEKPEKPEKPEQLDRPGAQARRAGSENNAPGTLIATRLPAKPGRTRLQVDCELSWKLATNIQIMIRQAEDAEMRGALAEEINPDIGKVVAGTDTQ